MARSHVTAAEFEWHCRAALMLVGLQGTGRQTDEREAVR